MGLSDSSGTAKPLHPVRSTTDGDLVVLANDKVIPIVTAGTGPPGPKGDKGDPGDPGADGAPGTPGAPGVPGVDGVDGAPGAKGDKGDTGAPGVDGTQGPAGNDGSQGIQGQPGSPGQDGGDGDAELLWPPGGRAAGWMDVPFNAGDFTAQTGNWTVSSGQVNTWMYRLDGDLMHVHLWVQRTQVSTTTGFLLVKIPGGLTARQTLRAVSLMIVEGTNELLSRAQVSAGGNMIALLWGIGATSGNVIGFNNFNTDVEFDIAFPV